MSVRNVRIKNYKCFQDKNIELSNLTVLTGRNSAGKSSFIQSLLLFELAGQGKRIYTNNVFGLNLGLPTNLINFDSINTISEGSGQEFEITIDNNTQKLFFEEERFADNYLSVNTFPKASKKGGRKFYYINAERFGPRVSQMIEKTDVEEVGSFGQNTLFVLNRVSLRYRPSSFPERMKKANGGFQNECEYWVNTIIDDVQFEVKVNDNLGVSSLRFKENGVEILPTNVGFGISYMLPIIVQGLYLSILNNGDGHDRVLIVENPEAHLHPYGQSKIGQFLAELSHKGGVQVIVETHSDHVVNGIRLYNLRNNNTESQFAMYYFDKQGGEQKIFPIGLDSSGEILDWPKGFFDQAKMDLFEMMKYRLGR
ncbi:DUF3696 domain-containing protein [Streptococcus suis]|uniref:DUF3696 domain-containing protein n=1 Tax=Streptococcus suis TaxID=1307 RepID=UPI0004147944|nr:DUF3696 domain-containing protein [Streptococcus suis]